LTWSALLAVGFSTFPSILISMISVKTKIIWLSSEEGLDYAAFGQRTQAKGKYSSPDAAIREQVFKCFHGD
jgi:hypothetical protein